MRTRFGLVGRVFAFLAGSAAFTVVMFILVEVLATNHAGTQHTLAHIFGWGLFIGILVLVASIIAWLGTLLQVELDQRKNPTDKPASS